MASNICHSCLSWATLFHITPATYYVFITPLMFWTITSANLKCIRDTPSTLIPKCFQLSPLKIDFSTSLKDFGVRGLPCLTPFSNLRTPFFCYWIVPVLWLYYTFFICLIYLCLFLIPLQLPIFSNVAENRTLYCSQQKKM